MKQARPGARHTVYRYVLCVRPNGTATARIAGERNALELRTPQSDDRFHMTLWLSDDFGEVQPDLIAEVGRALDGRNLARCPIMLDTVSGGFGSVVLVAHRRQSGIMALRRAMIQLLEARGIVHRRGKSFNPHITIGYDKRFHGKRATRPIEWTAQELVLIESHVGRTRHVVRGRWPLCDESGTTMALPLFPDFSPSKDR